ncbi:MAG: DUF1573 domain-containing protein [Flavobacteriales bacterium]|nr:DUF1573 domain-containing protein [Flavobacteriales bacterium]
MKKAILFFSFAIAAFGVQTVSAQTATGPKISFEKDVVDYGEVEYASNRERVWTFKNTGKEPLMITNATGSCGCTVPSFPKEPIMPGKTGEIKINYDTNRQGAFEKTVTITTNEPDGSNSHTIKVKGTVKSAPAAQPASK